MSRILLADDDEIVADIVRNAFDDTEHDLGWLPDGSSALAAIHRDPPDLVILDCNMPGLSGVSVLRELRNCPDLRELPVLMLTSRQSQNDERIVRHEGANDYMRKPFRPQVLAERAQALLDGQRPRA